MPLANPPCQWFQRLELAAPYTTLRKLAARLDLSIATVSEALRNSPRVKPATRLRVQRAAEKAGYRRNPVIGAAFSAVRRKLQHAYHGTLALIDAAEDGHQELMLFHREIVAGAGGRAAELGFHTELFWIGEQSPALPHRRLPAILNARGISGAVILPFNLARDLSNFDFSRISAVQMDHCLIRPQLHTIVPDHYISMIHALDRLTERGYKRIGLCIETRKDARLRNKWSAAFWGFFHSYARDIGLPPLIEPELEEARFLAWFKKFEPDLIVGHKEVMAEWLHKAGYHVPEDVGFFNLNVTERTRPCAGLDLQPRRLGAAAVEAVVGMMNSYERGVPDCPKTTTLEALWVEGPTILAASAAAVHWAAVRSGAD